MHRYQHDPKHCTKSRRNKAEPNKFEHAICNVADMYTKLSHSKAMPIKSNVLTETREKMGGGIT
jgi:hypothetical protein